MGTRFVVVVATLFPRQKQEGHYFHLVWGGKRWSRSRSWNISVRFSKLPCAPWMSHYRDFFLWVISVCLTKHAHIFRCTLVCSRNFFSRTFKWQRSLTLSFNGWQIGLVYGAQECLKLITVQSWGTPHSIIHVLFSANGPRLGKQRLWRPK